MLPSGLTTPFERLAETHRRMAAVRHSPEAWLTFELIQAIGRTGPDLERLVVDFFANEASAGHHQCAGAQDGSVRRRARIAAMLGWPQRTLSAA